MPPKWTLFIWYFCLFQGWGDFHCTAAERNKIKINQRPDSIYSNFQNQQNQQNQQQQNQNQESQQEQPLVLTRRPVVAHEPPAQFSFPSMVDLDGECFSLSADEYEFNVCPFQNVTQHFPAFHVHFSLGIFEGWNEDEHTFSPHMSFIHGSGESCPNASTGEKRSTKLFFGCLSPADIATGSDPRGVLSFDDGDGPDLTTCQFEMTLHLPRLCNMESVGGNGSGNGHGNGNGNGHGNGNGNGDINRDCENHCQGTAIRAFAGMQTCINLLAAQRKLFLDLHMRQFVQANPTGSDDVNEIASGILTEEEVMDVCGDYVF